MMLIVFGHIGITTHFLACNFKIHIVFEMLILVMPILELSLPYVPITVLMMFWALVFLAELGDSHIKLPCLRW